MLTLLHREARTDFDFPFPFQEHLGVALALHVPVIVRCRARRLDSNPDLKIVSVTLS